MRNFKKIISKLDRTLVADSFSDTDPPFIVTPFSYPNGDSVNLYFKTKGGVVEVSDYGATLDSISMGESLSPQKRKLMEAICKREGVSISKSDLSKKLGLKKMADDCFQFCQAITQVAVIHYQHGESQGRSQSSRALDKLLEKKTKRPFVKNWSESSIDPEGSFPVDYHFNGQAPARNIFFVGSDKKALLVAAVVHFLIANDIKIETMSVVDANASINETQLHRLQISSTELRMGISGNEKDIVDFAAAKNN